MIRRAKIVATLGPASSNEKTIDRLLRAGADVVRLNMSHGDHDQHRTLFTAVRRISALLDKHVPVLMDLMGPRYRLGEVPGGGSSVKRGQRLSFGSGAASDLPIDDPDLLAHLAPGERLLIDNGLIELRIESRQGGDGVARVVSGGRIATAKGINLPDSDLPFTISDKDRSDIALAVELGADLIAASYVGRARDLVALRAAIAEAGGNLPLVAKMERGRAVSNLEEIVREADAVMVARGDLGVEVPLHRVPVLQKRIVNAGRRLGKPTIVATQMLESMMERPRPTRAETSDVANAVFDGADAVMLSGETAAGRHPVEAVRTMNRIVREAEAYPHGHHLGSHGGPDPALPLRPEREEMEPGVAPEAFEIADTVSAAAVTTTQRLKVRQIVAFSQGGFTARMISRYRPRTPILMFTTEPQVARRLQLVWGVRPRLIDVEVEHLEEVVRWVDSNLQAAGLAKPGDRIVILMGEPIHRRSPTNLLRVHLVGSC